MSRGIRGAAITLATLATALVFAVPLLAGTTNCAHRGGSPSPVSRQPSEQPTEARSIPEVPPPPSPAPMPPYSPNPALKLPRGPPSSAVQHVPPPKKFSTAPDLAKSDAKPTPLSIVDAALQRLDWGRVDFDPVEEMRYKERYVVEVVVTANGQVADFPAALTTKAGAESAMIRISARMEAHLTGLGFSIKAISPELQAVARLKPTRWRWEVVPEEPGKRVLNLQLYARMLIDGSDTPLGFETYDRNIEVKITVPERVVGFAFDHFQWLWAALLVPLAGYTWKLVAYIWKRWSNQALPGPARPASTTPPATQ